jgi:outer membrane biosynthesis protein TonB
MSIATFLLGCAAGRPAASTLTSRTDGRSCDGAAAPHADTTVDSRDPLLRTVQPTGAQRTPLYPAEMRTAGVSGRVIASFIIDTLGRVPAGGAWIQEETRPSFGDAVCAYLRRAEFSPLILHGRRLSVRVVDWPNAFEIVR